MAIINWTCEADILTEQKERKIEHLKNDCRNAIESGFEIGEYWYNYEKDNQINFQDMLRLFDGGVVEEVTWNAYLDGEKVRKKLTKQEFTDIYLAGVTWKNDCLSRLNDELIPRVREAETVGEVEAIKWEKEQTIAFLTRSRRMEAREEVKEIMLEKFIRETDLTEEQWRNVLEMYPEYEVGKGYRVGDVFRYGDNVFEVVQEHRSQEDWKPDSTQALYKPFKKKETGGGEIIIEEWKQPTGAHDAYHKGDRVLHGGKVWASVFEGENVWEPGVYGWEEVTE